MASSLNSEYTIVLATDRESDQVLSIVSKMWGADVTARVQWLYKSNPHGKALTWLAIEGSTGVTVGCTSIFPRRVWVSGVCRTGAIGGDCYVEPRARRRGLATALHRRSLSRMKDFGIEFMYGPPNPNNLGALLKSGSQVVTSFARFVRPLSGRALFSRGATTLTSRLVSGAADVSLRAMDLITRKSVCGLVMEPETGFGAEYDELNRRLSGRHGIVPGRDASYLRWRYVDAPLGRQVPFGLRLDGELVGFLAIEIGSSSVAVVDLFAAPDPVILDSAIGLVLGHARDLDAPRVEISCTDESVFMPALRRAGFIRRSRRIFQIATASDLHDAATLLDGSLWSFTSADKDIDTVFSEPPE